MADKLPGAALFCDEAGKEPDRFLGVGGLVVTSQDAKAIKAEFARKKADLGISGEAKWNVTKKSNLDRHRELIHWIFQLILADQLHFHCLLVPSQRFNHNLREDGGKSESLKRMYYQLIVHRLGKRHGKVHSLYVFPDKANELKGLEEMKRGLNSDLQRNHGCPQDCVKAIEFRESHSEPLLQLNDLILGAVVYQKNRKFDAEGAGHPKASLAGFVLGRSGLKDYETDTPREAKRFTIWNFRSPHLLGGR